MTALSRNRKTIALVVATVACAAVVSVALNYPRPIAHPLLGGDWQCSRTAFLTSCTRNGGRAPIAGSLSIAPIALRQGSVAPAFAIWTGCYFLAQSRTMPLVAFGQDAVQTSPGVIVA